MKVYKFDCESCGSKQYIKTKSGYKCKYCGSLQDVISFSDEQKHTSVAEINTGVQTSPNPEMRISSYFRQEAKRTLVLFLVCLFVGVYGVHRFMQHKFFTGIIYLFTFGLFGIGWFIDIVKLSIKLAVEWKASGGV